MYNTKGHQILSIDTILSRITEYDIFKYYIKDFDIPKIKFCSEIRKDVNPSCSIKVLENGKALYRDWATGDTYDCFKYIQVKYSLTLYESLKVISNDFNLELHKGEVERGKTMTIIGEHNRKQPIPSITKLRIVSISFTGQGISYWNSFGISKEILLAYNVKQISHYYINTTLITIPKQEIAFSYAFGNYKYKILRPLNIKWKWATNADASIIQGYNQLSESGELLFITKSLKDIMVLHSVGFNAIAPQSENTILSLDIIKQLVSKWNTIIIYYDNDIPGITAAKVHSELYGIKYIYNALEGPKDASDYYKEHGRIELKNMILKLIERHE